MSNGSSALTVVLEGPTQVPPFPGVVYPCADASLGAAKAQKRTLTAAERALPKSRGRAERPQNERRMQC
jgi:hypothetical protein